MKIKIAFLIFLFFTFSSISTSFGAEDSLFIRSVQEIPQKNLKSRAFSLGATPPSPISTCEELHEIRNNLSGKYYLTNDIDCEGFNSENGGFLPIGARNANNSEIGFSGELDGRGYKVLNLTITGLNSEQRVGLFSTIDGGEVKNLSLVNVDIKGKDWVGGLAGFIIYYSEITDVRVQGRLELVTSARTPSLPGGLGGLSAALDTSTATNVSVDVDLISYEPDFNSVGGLVHQSYDSVIWNAKSNVNIRNGKYVGGIVAQLGGGRIVRSVSEGRIEGGNANPNVTLNFAGGLVGYGWAGDIVSSYSTAEVVNASRVGGLVGRFQNYQEYVGRIGSSFFAGTLNMYPPSNNRSIGGLIGRSTLTPGNVVNSYWNYERPINNSAYRDEFAISDAQMRNQSTFTDWDFANTWMMCEGEDVLNDHPHLISENYECPANLIARDLPAPPTAASGGGDPQSRVASINVSSVAVDATNLIMGSPRESVRGQNSGGLYFYKRQGDTWVQRAGPFVASDVRAGDFFGTNVALDGDNLFVSNGSTETVIPKVHILRKSLNSWVRVNGSPLTLSESPTSPIKDMDVVGDNFVAINDNTAWMYTRRIVRNSYSPWFASGQPFSIDEGYTAQSVDHDGDRIVIAAGRNDSTDGRIYVLSKTGSQWSQESVIDGPHYRLAAISGDRIVIGNTNPIIYENINGVWTQTATLPAESAMGCTPVAVHGDAVMVASKVNVHTEGDITSGDTKIQMYRLRDGQWRKTYTIPISDSYDMAPVMEGRQIAAVVGNGTKVFFPGDNLATLTLNVTGSGKGTITSSPDDMYCSKEFDEDGTGQCTVAFVKGEPVRLSGNIHKSSILNNWGSKSCPSDNSKGSTSCELSALNQDEMLSIQITDKEDLETAPRAATVERNIKTAAVAAPVAQTFMETVQQTVRSVAQKTPAQIAQALASKNAARRVLYGTTTVVPKADNADLFSVLVSEMIKIRSTVSVNP